MQNNKPHSLFLLSVALVMSLFAFGCSDNPAKSNDPVNEPESITTVKLRFVQTDDTTKVFNAQWRDLDGEGGNAPVVDSLKLPAGKSFSGSVEILDETQSPVENITEEIEEEDEEHQLFYIVSSANLTVQYADTDSDGNPLGLKTTVTTGAVGSGTLRVVLKHEATKNNTISVPSTDGETDFDIVLPVAVQ